MKHDMNLTLDDLMPNQIISIYHQMKNLEAKDINVINFAFDAPKFEIPNLIFDAAFEILKHNKSIEPSITGIPELKTEVCDYIDRTRMFRPKLNQILIGPGRNCLLFAILYTLLNKGDTVVVPDPGLPIYFRIPTMMNARIKFLPSIVDNKFRIDMSKLDSSIEENTKAVILNTPQNPTGDVISNTKLQEISGVVDKYNALLISDETYSQLTYNCKHVSPAIFDRSAEQTIIIEDIADQYSMSGWGLGFCIGPTDFIEKVRSFMTEVFPPVPEFIQYAGAKALSNNDELKPMLLKEYEKCCNIMVDGLNDVLGFSCTKPEGGAFVFPNISSIKMTSRKLADDILEKAGVAVLPGEAFGASGKDFIRISFATSEERINEGITRLQEMF